MASVTLTSATRSAACDAIVDRIDQGTTDANGDLVIMATADAEVATLAMANPAFGAAAAGVATANAIADDTNATGGTAIAFKLQDRDNVEVLRGDAATSGASLNMSSTTVGAGDTVSVGSMTVTVPAS